MIALSLQALCGIPFQLFTVLALALLIGVGIDYGIFHPEPSPEVRRMICAILAGYAWDQNNPYVRESKRRLGTLEQRCASVD